MLSIHCYIHLLLYLMLYRFDENVPITSIHSSYEQLLKFIREW